MRRVPLSVPAFDIRAAGASSAPFLLHGLCPLPTPGMSEETLTPGMSEETPTPRMSEETPTPGMSEETQQHRATAECFPPLAYTLPSCSPTEAG